MSQAQRQPVDYRPRPSIRALLNEATGVYEIYTESAVYQMPASAFEAIFEPEPPSAVSPEGPGLASYFNPGHGHGEDTSAPAS